SLISIIKNKSFKLTRTDLLNDKAEILFGDTEIHKQSYNMCFTGEKEYISMWAMYGKASGIKLRLDFPQEEFTRDITGDCFYENEFPKINYVKLWNVPQMEAFSLLSVAYLDKESKTLKHNGGPFVNLKYTDYIEGSLTGYVKYDAWEFEKEIRLRTLYSTGDRKQPKSIFLKINQNLINQFHITFSPWLSKEMQDEIRKCLDSLAGSKLSYDESVHCGEINEM
ncbi:MAG: DUF2971 domain-containing protein, partial [Lachnospiraceae bacterium]|nr:DUF2971 domain-containing protein [Candidatus Darwinimomas equi]